jgi:REP element-mobilizing transposase RayT
LRRGRISLPQHVYFITTTTANRYPHFADPIRARAACRVIEAKATWGDAQLMSWVLMPDHWHGLVQLGQRDSLPLVVNRFKSRVTKALRANGTTDPIWARSYFERAVRADHDLETAARYLVADPVRAGLVSRAGDWPFLDTRWL